MNGVFHPFLLVLAESLLGAGVLPLAAAVRSTYHVVGIAAKGSTLYTLFRFGLPDAL